MGKFFHNAKNKVFKHTFAVRKRRPIPKAKRRAIWIKHIGSHIFSADCLSCGSMPIDPFSFESGHVVAHSKGGSDAIDNLVPICSICNKDMGTMDMRQYMRNQFNRVLGKVLVQMRGLNTKAQRAVIDEH